MQLDVLLRSILLIFTRSTDHHRAVPLNRLWLESNSHTYGKYVAVAATLQLEPFWLLSQNRRHHPWYIAKNKRSNAEDIAHSIPTQAILRHERRTYALFPYASAVTAASTGPAASAAAAGR